MSEMRLRTALTTVLTTVGVLLAVAPAASTYAATTPIPRHQGPPATGDITAGIAVYDRLTQRFTERSDATRQFRSASLVKLLIALDHLWDLGPDYALPEADRALLDVMLRSSDDDAASTFWARNGRAAIVERMVARLDLRNTAPPAAPRTGWGSTTLSADDVVRIYRYILERAPAPVRDHIMGNLHQATRCGTDGFDQSFGIAGAFRGSRAFKQGWINFGQAPRNPCVETDSPRPAATTAAPAAPAASAEPVEPREIDYSSGTLHTTGTVGRRDRVIVAVLTTHPVGTEFARAAHGVTALTRSLRVPGAVRAPVQPPLPPPADGYWFGTYSSNVPVQAEPNRTSTRVGTVPSGVEVLVRCQTPGELVGGNDLWAYLPELGGYMPNTYFEYPDNRLPVVPDC